MKNPQGSSQTRRWELPSWGLSQLTSSPASRFRMRPLLVVMGLAESRLAQQGIQCLLQIAIGFTQCHVGLIDGESHLHNLGHVSVLLHLEMQQHKVFDRGCAWSQLGAYPVNASTSKCPLFALFCFLELGNGCLSLLLKFWGFPLLFSGLQGFEIVCEDMNSLQCKSHHSHDEMTLLLLTFPVWGRVVITPTLTEWDERRGTTLGGIGWPLVFRQFLHKNNRQITRICKTNRRWGGRDL